MRQMSGGYHFNEVFLSDVFVPESGLIGHRGGGWAVLRTMLASERAAIGGGTSGRSAVHLVALAKRLGRTDDVVVRQLVAGAYARERVLDLLQARVVANAAIPPGGSVTKLLSRAPRHSADDALQILGAAGMTSEHPNPAPWVERLLFAPVCGSVGAPTRSSAMPSRSGASGSPTRAAYDRVGSGPRPPG